MTMWITAWLLSSVALVVYTYLGYPLLVGAFSRLKRVEPPPHLDCPSVTMVIPALDEEAVIAAKLDNTLELDFPSTKLDVIVATDGSTDQTPDIVRMYESSGVRLSHRSDRRSGKVAALNHALSEVIGDVVVISDANTFLDPISLRALVAPFADRSVGLVTGAKHIVVEDGALAASEGLYWRYESYIKESESRLGSCLGVSGELLAVRRELFDPIPDGVINDDTYLLMRTLAAGFRSQYASRARSFERVSETQADERERRARMVAGRLDVVFRRRLIPWRKPVLMWQFISHKILRAILPLAMASTLIASVAAVVIDRGEPLAVTLLGAQAGFYAVAALGPFLSRLPDRVSAGRLGKLLYLPAFIVQSNLATFAGLLRFIRGRQRPSWKKAKRRIGAVP